MKWLIVICIILQFCGCASAGYYTKEYPQNINLKYPVILVHGIIAHDRGGIIDFWGRIPETLEKNGIEVFFGNTDAWGSYESNAEILKDTVDRVLLETSSDKVNIIAHSKGGLDSRYFIWKYDYGGKVASLTTISTPHHGAELADLVFQQRIVHTNMTRRALDVFGKFYGDINPDIYNVNYQLTTENMMEFNDIVEIDERVFYQSIYAAKKNQFNDLLFFFSYLYLNRVAGDNDGVVSEVSARWSSNITRIDGLSHRDIIDYKKVNKSEIFIPDIYLNIARDLSNRGY
ncbi:MAG: hypothetical protein FWD40_05755 [Treponema sp.]|nr:hypothetical protein [Treponema sp.]